MFSDIWHQEAQNCEFPREGKQIRRGDCSILLTEGVPNLQCGRGSRRPPVSLNWGDRRQSSGRLRCVEFAGRSNGGSCTATAPRKSAERSLDPLGEICAGGVGWKLVWPREEQTESNSLASSRCSQRSGNSCKFLLARAERPHHNRALDSILRKVMPL